MRTPIRLGLLAGCCAALAACTATAPKGPDPAVTAPHSVGKPQPPASTQAALSREAFTPYAALGQSHNDGLAPGESTDTLTDTCMHAAGYPAYNSGYTNVNVSANNLAFALPWGTWGYLGTAAAEQNGFGGNGPGYSNAQGMSLGGGPGSNLSMAEHAALGKCVGIVAGFLNTADSGPLAGIQTLSNDVYSDLRHSAAVNTATRAWSACMAKNGYASSQPEDFGSRYRPAGLAPESASVKKAQTSAAVTDAKCTQSTDLAGIYFAVQASYERQIVSSNQQALTTAAHRYRALYAKELAKMPQLLRKAKANPFLHQP